MCVNAKCIGLLITCCISYMYFVLFEMHYSVLSVIYIHMFYPQSPVRLFTGWERTGQMLCIVDTYLSVLMTLRMSLRGMCCLFTV